MEHNVGETTKVYRQCQVVTMFKDVKIAQTETP